MSWHNLLCKLCNLVPHHSYKRRPRMWSHFHHIWNDYTGVTKIFLSCHQNNRLQLLQKLLATRKGGRNSPFPGAYLDKTCKPISHRFISTYLRRALFFGVAIDPYFTPLKFNFILHASGVDCKVQGMQLLKLLVLASSHKVLNINVHLYYTWTATESNLQFFPSPSDNTFGSHSNEGNLNL